jgi:anti-repressor protein
MNEYMNDYKVLVKIDYTKENPTVMGRELHTALEIKTAYKDWFPRMIAYGFTENVDYQVRLIFEPNSNGGKQSYTDHEITLDMAKEICMLQRSEKGKQFRQYFIEVEKQWRASTKIDERTLAISKIINAKNELEQAYALRDYTALVEKPLLKTIEEQTPKVEYHDNVLNTPNLITPTTIAKDMGLKSANELNKILYAKGVIYKQGNVWHPYSNYEWLLTEKYMDYKSYDEQNVPPQLRWTEKGRKWLMEDFLLEYNKSQLAFGV